MPPCSCNASRVTHSADLPVSNFAIAAVTAPFTCIQFDSGTVGQTASGLNAGGHVDQFVLDERVGEQFSAENLSFTHIRQRLLKRRRHHTQRARRRLQATAGKAVHLQIEAAPDAACLANDVAIRHKHVLKRQRKRVHAAIADGRNRTP